MADSATSPDAPGEPSAEPDAPMARREFLRMAGVYSGTLAAGVAAAGKVQLDNKRPTSGRGRASSHTSRPTGVHPVTLPSGVTIPVADWVVEENKRPGTLSWVVLASTMMYGYSDHVSATHGDNVTLFVDAPQPTYRVELYRTGYYGGLGGRRVWSSAELTGVVQAAPTLTPCTNMIECDWQPSIHLTIKEEWPPGFYLFKLIGDATGSISGWVPLIVRDDKSTAAVAIMSAVTTAQAYNTWGGYSLYVGPGAADTRSRVVSYDRPYDYKSWGAPNFIGNEFPLVFQAESLGLDVSYLTDIDLHAQPGLLQNHKCLFSLGHDEYWSQVMRDEADKAIDAGVNVAFLGANAIYRHIRLEASPLGPNRHQVCYKTDLMREDPQWGVNPAEVTADWPTGPVPMPEQTIIGEQYVDVGAEAGMTIVNPGHWAFKGTGLAMNQTLPGVILGEYDHYDRSYPGPGNVELLAHSQIANRGPGAWSDVTYYTRPGGGGVLATGTASFISFLSNAPRIYPNLIQPAVPVVTAAYSRMMENVYSVFGAGPASASHPSAANWQSFYT
jgi:hypothetical protein